MKITNEFTVHTPIEQAWKLLTDLEAIAPCMPGAQLTGVEGDTYKGKVKIKVGPVISEFAGTARFVEKSDTDYRAAIDAKGRDPRSAGNAAAVVTAVLRPDGDSTTVSVDTDLKITGKLAQFGSGMIKEVSSKLLAQFVTNLEARLAADPAPADSAPADSAVAGSGVAGSGVAGSDSAPGAEGSASPESASASGPASASRSASPAAEAERAASAAVETVPATAVSPAPVSPAPIHPARINGVPLTASAPAPAAELDTAEAEPLDLLSIAGGSVYKRLIPVAVGALALFGVLAWLAGRRRR